MAGSEVDRDRADRDCAEPDCAARVAATCWTDTLPDGRTVWIGPLLHSDREALAREYLTLSPGSQRSRFLGMVPELTPQLLRSLVDGVDGVDHIAFVAFLEQDGVPVPVGVGRILRYPMLPDTADLAVTVKDAWHGQGVGGVLTRQLVTHRPAGVEHLLTEVLADNRAPLAMLSRVGPMHRTFIGSGAVEVSVDIPA